MDCATEIGKRGVRTVQAGVDAVTRVAGKISGVVRKVAGKDETGPDTTHRIAKTHRPSRSSSGVVTRSTTTPSSIRTARMSYCLPSSLAENINHRSSGDHRGPYRKPGPLVTRRWLSPPRWLTTICAPSSDSEWNAIRSPECENVAE